MRIVRLLTILLGALLLTACSVGSGSADATPTLISLPTPAAESAAAPAPHCADIDRLWGSDWPALIGVLESLRAAAIECGDQPLISKQYAAHMNYGSALEAAGDLAGAVAQYQAALALDGTRAEAYAVLTRLNALPPATPPPCTPLAAPLPAPALSTDPAQFVRAEGEQLFVGDAPYVIRGANYFSVRAQWHRFWTAFDEAAITRELDLMAGAGMNTIRVFLWHEPFFTCTPEEAVPVPETFAKLDRLLTLAEARGLRVILTLHDLPDLIYRPLYTDYARYDAQTAFFVGRYRDYPVILAWDLRNEGDIDYGAGGREVKFPQETVINWLAHSSERVRASDPNHLLTAGWLDDPSITAPYVDILSFHHWSSSIELALRIDAYRASTDQPLLMEEVGYASWTDAPINPTSPQVQAELLGAALRSAEEKGIAGWLVWTAFDYIPFDAQFNFEHFMGLWDVNGNPKPALNVLPMP